LSRVLIALTSAISTNFLNFSRVVGSVNAARVATASGVTSVVFGVDIATVFGTELSFGVGGVRFGCFWDFLAIVVVGSSSLYI